MGELIGNDAAAENAQAFAIRNRFECTVIYVSNQLGTDQRAEIELEPGESSYLAKNPIGPIGSLQRHPVILHESLQERRVTLLLPDEQFNYPDQVRGLPRPFETFGSPQECPSLRLFAELKRCDGTRNQLQFVGPQDIGKAVRNTAQMQGVIFEMIQPDLEISGTHGAALLITLH
jgi:hypothetical protein